MRLLRAIILLHLLALALPVAAEELHIALYGQRHDLTLRSGGVDVDTHVGRLGITVTAIYSPRIEASLDAGYADLTQTGNPATQGMSLGGNYGGVTLRFWPLRSGRLDGWVQGDYSAQSVSGSNNGQNTKIDWYDSGVSAGLVLRMGAVDLYAGARYGNLSGDEIASGNLVFTRSISVENKTTSWVGANLYVDRSGTIGITYDSGGRRGLSVRFARRF